MKKMNTLSFKMIAIFTTVSFLIFCFNPVRASILQDIPVEEEYSSGTFDNQISYAWVHSNKTSFLSLTMYDEITGMSPIAPFYPFFGQSFNVTNNPFFVGTVITGFELYQDSNDNDILDLEEELNYYVMLNASQGIILPQIEKVPTDNKTIYSWKVGYLEVDGFFQPSPPQNDIKTIIDSVNLTYTFEISRNYSELKLAIEMGAWDAYEFSFDDGRGDDVDLSGYSLSILFGTTISSEKPISISLVNETTGISNAIIKVNDVPIFQSLFQDSYDLGLNGSAYPAYATTARNETIEEQGAAWRTPDELYNWWSSFFSSMSKLTKIPPLGIKEVSFLYRICYPVWSAEPFNHDPRYRALFEGEITPEITPTSELSSESSYEDTSETSSTDLPTPSFLIPEVLVLLILVPFVRKKRKT
ncbi:MAG: hypothetical protein ACXADY_08385 [Candidatus Hodarchaeales archaeon]|jgi:hypothetical protein